VGDDLCSEVMVMIIIRYHCGLVRHVLEARGMVSKVANGSRIAAGSGEYLNLWAKRMKCNARAW